MSGAIPARDEVAQIESTPVDLASNSVIPALGRGCFFGHKLRSQEIRATVSPARNLQHLTVRSGHPPWMSRGQGLASGGREDGSGDGLNGD